MDSKKRSAEHTDIVKSLHKSLRKKVKSGASPDTVWNELLEDAETLEQYSSSMHQLASAHWEENSPESRITWCHCVCQTYFKNGGMIKAVRKQEKTKLFQSLREKGLDENDEERNRIDASMNDFHFEFKSVCDDKLLVLDVGSCFNPFSKFDEFSVIPVDISPAVEGVMYLDFLNVTFKKFIKPKQIDEDNINRSIKSCIATGKLFCSIFDVVVFSLLLSYFPSPSQRLECCRNAHRCLQLNGLLLIITPDSSHQNKNTKMMKVWKHILEAIGFTRYKYEKLRHLHCMAYRKSSMQLLDLDEDCSEEIFIPQDLQESEADQ